MSGTVLAAWLLIASILYGDDTGANILYKGGLDDACDIKVCDLGAATPLHAVDDTMLQVTQQAFKTPGTGKSPHKRDIGD